ncbi:MAG: FAD-dependent oxidoreductase [Candidatus Omnitrophica bacterium]|nr:FAD-dependent oxidoreductase [Candidatus Omnitrophota bacterium]
MSVNSGTIDRPLRVAIVGSGPSGFYAAGALQQADLNVQIDMLDRLPAPFGLVRYGVAPDHDNIKVITRLFEKIAQKENFSFLGNVYVGKDISVEELKEFYDAIIFACGAETDRKLDIPGIDLEGSHTATEFVGWYNGHPDYVDREFDLSQEVVVIIGQGNVAIDVARILCKTVDELNKTDISQHALDILAESKIKEVHMVGRRGPVQSAFTFAEIEEIQDLKNCTPVFDKKYLDINEASRIELNNPNDHMYIRKWKVFENFAQTKDIKKRKLILDFYLSPVEIKGQGRAEKVIFEENELVGKPKAQKATGTGRFIEIDCGLFFRSVGYQGRPLGWVPFDEQKGIFPNKDGRILDGDHEVPGMYAVGWIGQGPVGVIGTNKSPAQKTVANLLADIPRLTPCRNSNPQAIYDFLKQKGVAVITFDDWKKIDAAEIARGQEAGKPREKFIRVEDMMNVVGKKTLMSTDEKRR